MLRLYMPNYYTFKINGGLVLRVFLRRITTMKHILISIITIALFTGSSNAKTIADVTNAEFIHDVKSSSINITWDNPDTSFKSILIVRSESPIIWDPNDGEPYTQTIPTDNKIIYDFSGKFYRDRDVKINTPYYYRIIVYDKNFNYSRGLTPDNIPISIQAEYNSDNLPCEFSGSATASSVQLNWEQPANQSYNRFLIRQGSDNDWKPEAKQYDVGKENIVCIEKDNTNCNLANLEMGTTYEFTLYAYSMPVSDGVTEYHYTTTGVTTEIKTHLGGVLSDNLHLERDTYFVDKNIIIPSNTTLDIDEDCILKFQPQTNILIQGGTLNSNNSQFKSADTDKIWQGIMFQGNEAAGLIENCSFMNASGYTSGNAIFYIHDASPTIKECIILEHNAAYGIFIEGKASPDVFNNQIKGKEYSVKIIYSNQTNPFFKNNQFGYSRNGDFLIQGIIDSSVHWTDENAIYQLSNMTVASGGSLEVTGNTIKVNNNGCIDVQGCFKAQNVFFTVANDKNELPLASNMQWQGIRFNDSACSRLESCVIERASGNADAFQGIVHITNSNVFINNVTIHNSLAQYGIYIQSGSPIITNNSIEKVAIGVFSGQEASPQAIVANSFFENEYAIKMIYGSENNSQLNKNKYQDSMISDVYISGIIKSDVSWNEDSAKYRIKDIIIEKGANLNIAKNHLVCFEENIPLVVKGTLNAQGVTFSSIDKYVKWNGIQFIDASAGELIDCVISQATGNSLTEGVIHIKNSSPLIQNCTLINNTSSSGITIQKASPHIAENTITHMNNFGIYISDQSSPTVSGNILNGNAYGIGIHYDQDYPMKPDLNRNDFTENTSGDVMLGGHICASVTWEGGKTYRLNSNLIIEKGAALTIQEKAIVRSDKNVQIHVLGTLIANDVTFSWADNENQWNGIQFEGTGSDKSQLLMCTIERANGYTQTEKIGIISFEKSNASLRYCQIDNSLAQYGISVHHASPVIHHNTINEMKSYAILVSGNAYPEMYTNTFNRNFRAAFINYNAENMGPLLRDNKYIDSADGDIDVMGTIKADTTWGNNETPVYRLISKANTYGLTIDAGIELTILPGVDIRAEKNTHICVKGILKAKENSFSWADGKNQWNGIMFDASLDSVLENCTIENASGYQTFDESMGVIYVTNRSTPRFLTTNILNCNANIGININNSRPTINNCLVSGLEKGIYIRTNLGPIITNNTFENNSYAIDIQYMADNNATQLKNNTYINNHEADVYVKGTIEKDITWGDGETPVYQISSGALQTNENKGLTISSGATLHINPNIIVKNEADTQIQVSGTIEAEHVLFTCADDKKMWNGIKIEDNNEENRSFLRHCTIEHAKGYNNGSDGIIYIKHSTVELNDNIIINCIAEKGIHIDDSLPIIENNLIDGMKTGILVNGVSEPKINNNTFKNNQYAIHLIYNDDTPILNIETQNIFNNNTKGDIYTSGSISGKVTWDNKCSTIYFVDQLTITSNAQLTIVPGNTVKFQSNGSIVSEGVLNAENVLFTHMDGEKSWQGIQFKSNGANASRLSNCVFEGAEGFLNAPPSIGVIHISNSKPQIVNCVFQNTQALLGISIENASPIIQGNIIAGMAKGIELLQGKSYPQITNNHLIQNLIGIETTYPDNQPIIKDNFFRHNDHSDVSVSGTITREVNWESNHCNAEYHAYSLCIDIGAKLNIHKGITVKFDKGGFFHVKGTLIATDVFFTWSNANRQWAGIFFDGIHVGESKLEKCHFLRSSGYQLGPDQSGIIYIHQTSNLKGFPQIIDCTFRDSIADVGIYIDNGHPLISNCFIEGMAHGIYIKNQSEPDVINNTIKDNLIGIFLDENVSGNYSYNSFSNNFVYGFFNNSESTVNAMNNYWGDIKGPYDPTKNLDTRGDEVSGFVNYDSWIGNSIHGDINGDEAINLKDIILAAQINSGIYPAGIILLSSDTNGDQQIGMEDIIFMLKQFNP